MAGNNWMGGWTGSGVALPAPASASFGNGGMGAFATARLDRPDRALRKIAIKQMTGQQLTANEIDRLARRQGVEARYEEAGNNNFGKMDSAYARAGAPVMMRQRLGAEGSTLGSMAARYGEDAVGDVQRLARERLLREEELGKLRLDAARFANGHMQEDYDWERAVRERNAAMSDLNLDAARMRNADAIQKRAEIQRERDELMALHREENQLANAPSSLVALEYRNADGSINGNSVLRKRMDEAARSGNFPAYSALEGVNVSRLKGAAAAQKEQMKSIPRQVVVLGSDGTPQTRTFMGTKDITPKTPEVKLTEGQRRIQTIKEYQAAIAEAIANGRADIAAYLEADLDRYVGQNRGNSTGTSTQKSGTSIHNDMNQQNSKSRGAVPLSTAAGGEKKPVAGKPVYISPTAGDKPWYEL